METAYTGCNCGTNRHTGSTKTRGGEIRQSNAGQFVCLQTWLVRECVCLSVLTVRRNTTPCQFLSGPACPTVRDLNDGCMDVRLKQLPFSTPTRSGLTHSTGLLTRAGCGERHALSTPIRSGLTHSAGLLTRAGCGERHALSTPIRSGLTHSTGLLTRAGCGERHALSTPVRSGLTHSTGLLTKDERETAPFVINPVCSSMPQCTKLLMRGGCRELAPFVNPGCLGSKHSLKTI